MTAKKFSKMVDQYQDSYCENLSIKELRCLIDSMPLPSVLAYSIWRTGSVLDQQIELKQRMKNLSSRYFQSDYMGLLFAGCVFYIASTNSETPVVVANDIFDMLHSMTHVIPESSLNYLIEDKENQLLILDIRLYGGIVVDCINSKTTHVVCNMRNHSKITHLLASFPSIGIGMSRCIDESWIDQSIQEGTLLPEAFANKLK